MKPEHKKPMTGIFVGAAMFLLGPLVGLAATVLSLQGAFNGMAHVDPSAKANALSQGIAGAVSATVVGLGFGMVGVVVALLSVLFLLRAKPTGSSPSELERG